MATYTQVMYAKAQGVMFWDMMVEDNTAFV